MTKKQFYELIKQPPEEDRVPNVFGCIVGWMAQDPMIAIIENERLENEAAQRRALVEAERLKRSAEAPAPGLYNCPDDFIGARYIDPYIYINRLRTAIISASKEHRTQHALLHTCCPQGWPTNL